MRRLVTGFLLAITIACGGGTHQTEAPPADAKQDAPDIAAADPQLEFFHEQLVTHGEDLQSDFGGSLLTLGMNPRDLQQDDPKHAYDEVLQKVQAVADPAVRRDMMRTFFNRTD